MIGQVVIGIYMFFVIGLMVVDFFRYEVKYLKNILKHELYKNTKPIKGA